MATGEELHALHEQAHEAQLDVSLKPVSASMAVLAVLVVAFTVLSHRAHTHEIISQSRIADGWAHYQSKSTRRYTAQVFRDLLGVTVAQRPEQVQALVAAYAKDMDRYGQELKEIEDRTARLEKDFDDEEKRATRFDVAEGIVEGGIVLVSVTLLTRRRLYWLLGLGLAAVGTAVGVSGFLVHLA